MRRYYNLTIQSQNPNTYGKSLACKTGILHIVTQRLNHLTSVTSPALIRMGDLFYEGQGDMQQDLFSAAEMYTQAALRNEPQVCFFEISVLIMYRILSSLCLLVDVHRCTCTCKTYCSSTGMVQPWPPC